MDWIPFEKPNFDSAEGSFDVGFFREFKGFSPSIGGIDTAAIGYMIDCYFV